MIFKYDERMSFCLSVWPVETAHDTFSFGYRDTHKPHCQIPSFIFLPRDTGANGNKKSCAQFLLRIFQCTLRVDGGLRRLPSGVTNVDCPAVLQ